MIGADAYTIWSVDSQGHFTVNIGNDLSGNSVALESFETSSTKISAVTAPSARQPRS
jgi:hypothetical protein